MSGIKICSGSVVAAGSVVTKSIDSYTIVGGVPAKIIKKRFSDEQISELLKIEWWNWPVEKIRENVMFLSSDNIERFIRKHGNKI